MLRSGGPRMTIVRLNPGVGDNRATIACHWFKNGEDLRAENWPPSVLKRADTVGVAEAVTVADQPPTQEVGA
jgi:uncharacterized protein YodC (DUF2158 family)